MPLAAIDEAGADIAAQVFTTNGGALTLARDAIPAMLTDDERVIRQDCLCYLMEQLARTIDPDRMRPCRARTPFFLPSDT